METPAATNTATGSFKQFIVHRQGSDVALSWSVSTSDVVEFSIERSYDGETFEPISTMPCSGTGTHHYKDAGVFPGTIWYRINATKTDQSVETSTTETVRIVKR
jgi:hypothetical protein